MNYQEQQESKAYNTVLDYLRTVRLNPSNRDAAWEHFLLVLEELSVDSNFKSAVQFWTLDNLEQHHPEAIRIRDLHEIEGVMISMPAYARLLDATHHGMISFPQGERLIEEMLESCEMQDDGCDASRMEQSLLHLWKKNMSKYKDLKIN